jgi:hypothetical protein
LNADTHDLIPQKLAHYNLLDKYRSHLYRSKQAFYCHQNHQQNVPPSQLFQS